MNHEMVEVKNGTNGTIVPVLNQSYDVAEILELQYRQGTVQYMEPPTGTRTFIEGRANR